MSLCYRSPFVSNCFAKELTANAAAMRSVGIIDKLSTTCYLRFQTPVVFYCQVLGAEIVTSIKTFTEVTLDLLYGIKWEERTEEAPLGKN